MKFNPGKFDRRTVVGKRYKCDTKHGKKCEPIASGWWSGASECKHCKRSLTKAGARR